jgi:hypothetical protein
LLLSAVSQSSIPNPFPLKSSVASPTPFLEPSKGLFRRRRRVFLMNQAPLADLSHMDRSSLPADTQNQIQFVLSLLHIANPGRSSPESDAVEQLLTVETPN